MQPHTTTWLSPSHTAAITTNYAQVYTPDYQPTCAGSGIRGLPPFFSLFMRWRCSFTVPNPPSVRPPAARFRFPYFLSYAEHAAEREKRTEKMMQTGRYDRKAMKYSPPATRPPVPPTLLRSLQSAPTPHVDLHSIRERTRRVHR